MAAMAMSMAACGNSSDKGNNGGTAKAIPLEAPVILGETLENLDASGTLNGQYAGKTITVATRAGDFSDALSEAAKYFEAASGAKVVVQSFPAGTDEEKIQLDLSTSRTFDVVLMPVANMSSYAASGFLQPLQPFIDSVADPNLNIDDFIPAVLDLYGRFNGELYAFPYKPDSQILFYRKDIFEDEQIKADFLAATGKELAVPETNEELLTVAKYFTRSENKESPVEYGFLSMGSNTNSRAIWMNRQGEYGVTVVDENLNPTVNNDGTKKALSVLVEMQSYAPGQWTELGWDEANAMFIDGKALMMEQWPGVSSAIQGENSKVNGKVGFAVTPGGSPVLGGWSIGVTKHTKEAELAYKFIEFATSKDGEMLKIPFTMDPTRNSNYERGTVMESNPMYPVLLDSLAKGDQLVDVNVPFLSAKLNDILEFETQNLMSGKQGIDEAAKNMQDRMQAEINK